MTKELLNLPDRFEILYLQGVSKLRVFNHSLQLDSERGSAAYADTGTWANKAIKEAKHLGDIEVVVALRKTVTLACPNRSCRF